MQKTTSEIFIEKAKQVHGNKYDYSKVNYINSQTKVCIICPEHGEFWQKPNCHLQGQGCPYCYGNVKKTTEQFISEAKAINGDKYDYSKSIYKGANVKVCIICPIHGEFWQTAIEHLKGHQCMKCSKIEMANKNTMSTEDFILKSNMIHNDKYDYTNTIYINNKNSVDITCPIHGNFKQIAGYHLQGNGCPKCALENNLNENKLYELLIQNLNTDVVRQKHFKWLKNKKTMSLDFYLPCFNIAIEYQGEQHFVPIKYFGGVKKYNENILRDKTKIELCKKNSIKLLHFTFNKKSVPENFTEYNVITDIDELIKVIKNE